MTVPASPSRETADQSWKVWTLIGLAAIWIGVAVISVASPDLVSGSEREHLPLAAFVSWIWGLIATIGFLWGMSKLRGSAEHRSIWIGLVVAVAFIWGIAAVLAAVLPTWETGSDPTILPIWAIVSPLAAALATALAAVIAGIFSESPGAER